MRAARDLTQQKQTNKIFNLIHKANKTNNDATCSAKRFTIAATSRPSAVDGGVAASRTYRIDQLIDGTDRFDSVVVIVVGVGVFGDDKARSKSTMPNHRAFMPGFKMSV